MAQVLSVKETELLQQVCDAVPAVIALLDFQAGRYIFINRAIKRILGYSESEFLNGGLDFAVSLLHPDDLAPMMAKNQAALAAANRAGQRDNEPIVSFEYRMKHKDSGWRWLQTEGSVFRRDDQGRVNVIINASIDITARKEAQSQFAESMKLLENVLGRS